MRLADRSVPGVGDAEGEAMSEQPMELVPTPKPAPVDGEESAAVKNMSDLDKLAEAAGVDPAALALLYKGENK